MSNRLHWVPLHSIVVVRDGKQIDALEEYKRTKKAFAFTKEEVDEIQGLNATGSLRAPNEEGVDEISTGLMSAATDTAPAQATPAENETQPAKEPVKRGKSAPKDDEL